MDHTERSFDPMKVKIKIKIGGTMRKYRLSGSMLLLATFALGCTSLSTLQDATTAKNGEFKYTVAVGQMSAEVTSDGSSGAKGTVGTKVSVPSTDVLVRYGITDNWEVNGRTNGTAFGAGTKYKLIDHSFKLSLGLNAQMVSFSSGDEQNGSSSSLTDIEIPVFLNYHFSDEFLIYLVPKYVARMTAADVTTNSIKTSENNSYGLMGGSVGLRWKFVFVEYTAMNLKVEDESMTISQGALGFTW